MAIRPPRSDEEPATYSSPPCFMHELDDASLGYLGRAELMALLNELLEAERAGARLAARLSRDAADTTAAATLQAVAQDEGRFCAMLGGKVAGLGGTPSQATGGFYDKVMALPDWAARCALLNRGQGWVVRKLQEALPRIREDALHRDLKEMLEVHQHNIRRCGSSEPDQASWSEVRAWRKRQRAALLEAPLSLSPDHRARCSAGLTERAMALLPALKADIVGVYWPFKGEYDLRPLIQALDERAIALALPVVVRKAEPMEFRAWRPGDRMTLGIWNMPVPAEGRPVLPGALLVPLLGFDRHGYRLGYGGGYYDRTLATLEDRPLLIGVGFEQGQLPSIHPQPHDIPMDLIVTEQRTRCVSDRGSKAWAAARENAGTFAAWRCLWSRD